MSNRKGLISTEWHIDREGILRYQIPREVEVREQYKVGSHNSQEAKTRVLRNLESLEGELSRGLLSQWLELMDSDPLASAFQGPGWCMSWYRSYSDLYEPIVVLVERAGLLVGLVPLAKRLADHRIDFASGSSADYRDIVSRQGERPIVVKALIDAYLSDDDFRGPLQVGWIDPQSDTPALLIEACREMNLPVIVRRQPCWRWTPPAPAKPSGSKFLKWYQRNSHIDFRRIENEPDWHAFRDEFYTQHSLRQLQSGRQLTFIDPRRRDFYDRLFDSSHVQTHVTGFFVGGRLAAGHFGVIWRDELLLGPPSIRLEDEARSPAIILLSWIIQNAEREGLKAFDFTTGDSSFKQRLGNACVTVSAVDVYKKRWAWYAVRGRASVVRAAKQVIGRTLGDAAWKSVVLPRLRSLGWKYLRFRELGLLRGLASIGRRAAARVYARRTGLVLRIRAEEVRQIEPVLPDGLQWAVNENCPEDLLKWSGASLETKARLAEAARCFGKVRADGRTLHTMVVDGRLAGWGYSHKPHEAATLTETPGVTFEFPAGAVSLYDFFILPEFRGLRLYQRLLRQIVSRWFETGASEAYITVLESNAASRHAIERVGFQVVSRNTYRRVFGKHELRRECIPSS